ncbi:ScbA/BarX family gamma-butyrolactone biosynthesis protein [Streptacidiphilus sp. PAMC 29251]
MTLTEQRFQRTGDPGALDFSRPVDRALVHRTAVMEVFATDCLPLVDGRWRVAVQLPRGHSYYNDHPHRPRLVDPLVLLESCRQAVTVVAHRHLGVPFGTSFLISTWQTVLAGFDRLESGRHTSDELLVDVTARGLRQRGGRLLSATFDVDLWLGGRSIGGSTLAAGYLSREGYQGYREMRRGSAPPMSDSMPTDRQGVPADAAGVGRTRPENVVLADLSRGPGKVSASLDVPVTHPAIYDHPLDHVPAMALLEAARQAALLAAGEPEHDGYADGFDARFSDFVELDAATTVTAELLAAPGADEGRAGGSVVEVRFLQRGATMCEVRVDVARTAREPAGDR